MNAYLILDITIHDFTAFSEYLEKTPAVIEKHSGRYIVRGEVPTVIEGDWHPERVVVIKFPARDHANAFVQDFEATQTLFSIRQQTSTSKLILVDGCL